MEREREREQRGVVVAEGTFGAAAFWSVLDPHPIFYPVTNSCLGRAGRVPTPPHARSQTQSSCRERRVRQRAHRRSVLQQETRISWQEIERLPGKGNRNSRGARQVHLNITMMKWIRTSRSSIKNSLSRPRACAQHRPPTQHARQRPSPPKTLAVWKSHSSSHEIPKPLRVGLCGAVWCGIPP